MARYWGDEVRRRSGLVLTQSRLGEYDTVDGQEVTLMVW